MRILLAVLLLFVCAPGSYAAESPWVNADQLQGRLIGAGDDLVIKLRLAEGWHTYWRVPGDAGLPPRFDWSGSKNLKMVDMDWPAPKRFEEFDLYTFGYEDEIIFPARMTRAGEGPVSLRLKLDVMVCKDICIPQVLNFSLEPEEEASPAIEKTIEFARRKVPVQGDLPGLKIDTVVAGPDGLVLSVFSQKGFEEADIFAFADLTAFTAPPEITVDEGEPRKALIKLPTPPDVEHLQSFLAGKELSLVFVAGKDAVEKSVKF